MSSLSERHELKKKEHLLPEIMIKTNIYQLQPRMVEVDIIDINITQYS